MKRTTIFTLIFVTSLIFSSCKKSNLTRDKWVISSATDLQDGSDITNDFAGEIWEYTKDGNYVENGTHKGTWVWGDGKEKLIITKINGNSDVFDITKLKKNEMWLVEQGEEELHLERLQ